MGQERWPAGAPGGRGGEFRSTRSLDPGRRSPIKLERTNLDADLFSEFNVQAPPNWRSEWKVRGPVKAAEFELRGRHGRERGTRLVLHPSTKERGRWQCSEFDREGAVGDSVRDTAQEALSARMAGWGWDEGETWRLVSVVGADGRVYGKGR